MKLGIARALFTAAAVLGMAQPAAAGPFNLYNFVVFSGGGATANSQNNPETSIGGHTTINGNIGSNQDLYMQGNPVAGYPAQLNGSAYVGGYLTMGQGLTIGGPSALREIVVNGVNAAAPAGAAEVDFSGYLYGNMFANGQASGLTVDLSSAARVYGNLEFGGGTCPNCDATHVSGSISSPSSKTFSLVTMPSATNFAAGGANQACGAGCTSMTLAPGTYGTLTTGADKTVRLSSGNYYFDAMSIGGSNIFEIDLSSGLPINIFIVGDATFGQSETLMVKGAGTGGNYVSINDPLAQSLAALIYWETHGRWVMGGGTDNARQIWGGTVYASQKEETGQGEIDLGQYVIWTGALYAFDSIQLADHGLYDYVRLDGTDDKQFSADPVPEPATLVLLGTGLLAVAARRRRQSRP